MISPGEENQVGETIADQPTKRMLEPEQVCCQG